MIANPPSLICYPPTALNGGPLESAPPKVGEFVWQPKVDDWRAVIHTPTGTVWNQYGQPSSITDKFPILSMLRSCSDRELPWLDVGMMNNRNDMMRGSIVVFDLIEADIPFTERRTLLQAMFPIMPLATTLMAGGAAMRDDHVCLIQSAWGEEEGRKLDAILRLENNALGRKFYEGVVCKRANSLYQFGRKPKEECPDWIKHRFDQAPVI